MSFFLLNCAMPPADRMLQRSKNTPNRCTFLCVSVQQQKFGFVFTKVKAHIHKNCALPKKQSLEGNGMTAGHMLNGTI